MSNFKIGDEVWFIYYLLTALPIISFDFIRIEKGILVGNQHEELDIYHDRRIICCLVENLFQSKHEAIDCIIKKLEELKCT